LTSLNDEAFVKVLNQKETGLVSMVLLQLLTGSGVEEKQFVQIIGALKLTSAMSDPEFEVILNLFDRVCEKKVIYSKETCELCIGMLSQM
jgi:hypothetical protein